MSQIGLLLFVAWSLTHLVPSPARAQGLAGTITGEAIQTIRSGSGIWDAHFHPGDASMVVVAAGRRFSLLNYQTIAENWFFTTEHPYLYMGSKLSPDGTLAASGGLDRLIITNVRTGQVLQEFALEDSVDFLTAIDFSEANDLLYVGGIEESTITVFDTENFETVATYRCPERCSITNVKLSSDRRLVYAATTTSVHIWDAITGDLRRSFATGYTLTTKPFKFTTNGEFLLVAQGRSKVALIDTETEEVIREFQLLTSGEIALAVNAEMTLLYTLSTDVAVGAEHQLTVWDIVTGEALQTVVFENPEREVLRSISISPDGTTLLRVDSGKMEWYRINP